MQNKRASSFNALKTGAYARQSLLPWEDPARRQSLCDRILADLRPVGALETRIALDIVENRWIRERLRCTSAIATHSQPFGRRLEKSGAKTWSDALKIVRELNVARHKTLERIASSISKIAEAATNGTVPDALEELVESAPKMIEVLTRMEAALDQQDQFFREYSPRELDRRIRLENATDAQFDKMLARLDRLQAARAWREKSSKSNDPAGTPTAKSSQNAPSEVSRPHEPEIDLDADDSEASTSNEPEIDLDADGSEASASHERKIDPDADDTVEDPLVEFMDEQGDERHDDEDDTDDWGQPKPRG